MEADNTSPLRKLFLPIILALLIVSVFLFFYFDGPEQDQTVGKSISDVWGGKE
jgi:hypothetical protein